jgi:ADP-dependent NAD(P)H-hydrate dehydratase
VKIFNFTDIQAKKLLPTRSVKGHKALYGKSLIVGGSPGMMGALVLCAKAASRIGSGYVYVQSLGAIFSALKNPDFLTSKSKKIDLEKFNAIAFGCGLGKRASAGTFLKKLLKESPDKVVLDADALNLLAKSKNATLPSSWILTPHEGELARLLGVSSKEIKADREKFLIKAAKKYKCIVLLKGMPTLITNGKVIYKVSSGNAALSKAGTGDVLTGMICGLLAQGLSPLDAALVGAELHGQAAALWLKDKNDIVSLMASDLLELLPRVVFKLRTKA